MRCNTCGHANIELAVVCGNCNKPLGQQPQDAQAPGDFGPGPRPDAGIEALRREKQEQEEAFAAGRRARLRSDAVTGAITFAGLTVLFGLIGMVSPVQFAIGLVLNTAVGLLVGYIISYQRAGSFKGALYSAATFGIVLLILNLPALFGELTVGQLVVGSMLAGIMVGAVPGFIIGLHAEAG